MWGNIEIFPNWSSATNRFDLCSRVHMSCHESLTWVTSQNKSRKLRLMFDWRPSHRTRLYLWITDLLPYIERFVKVGYDTYYCVAELIRFLKAYISRKRLSKHNFEVTTWWLAGWFSILISITQFYLSNYKFQQCSR